MTDLFLKAIFSSEQKHPLSYEPFELSHIIRTADIRTREQKIPIAFVNWFGFLLKLINELLNLRTAT